MFRPDCGVAHTIVAAAALLLGLSAPMAYAGDKLVANDPKKNDAFGDVLQLVGDTLVVGAPNSDTTAGENAGKVYVFERTLGAWVQQAKLKASDGAAQDTFGIDVSLSGDTLLVGSGSADIGAVQDAGAVYVFVRSGGIWTEQARLVQPVPTTNSWFGGEVALSGDTAVIGAGQDGVAAALAGAVYVFERTGTTWALQTTLTAPDVAPFDRFGSSVALSQDSLVVGAIWGDSPAAADTGCAYAYARSGPSWVFQQKLVAPDGASNDWFGYDLALSGNTVLVGVFNDTVGSAPGAGSAHVFVRDGASWSHQAMLTASDGTPVSLFGADLALDGDRALLGAPGDDSGGIDNAGSAYLFQRQGSTWRQADKLESPSGNPLREYGKGVTLAGDTLMVSDPWDGTGALPATGSVFVQSVQETVTPWADIGFTLQGEKGPPRLAATGTLLPDTQTSITLTNARANVRTQLLVSLTEALMAYKGGTLVPGAALLSVPIYTDALGSIALTLNAWPHGVPPGTVLYFQFPILDPAGPFGAALSNGLRATSP